MESIRRCVGYVILNTDAVEVTVAVCGLLIVWIVERAWIRRHGNNHLIPFCLSGIITARRFGNRAYHPSMQAKPSLKLAFQPIAGLDNVFLYNNALTEHISRVQQIAL